MFDVRAAAGLRRAFLCGHPDASPLTTLFNDLAATRLAVAYFDHPDRMFFDDDINAGDWVRCGQRHVRVTDGERASA
jgi:hypothetical protein